MKYILLFSPFFVCVLSGEDSDNLISFSPAELWMIDSTQEACIHAKISVPPNKHISSFFANGSIKIIKNKRVYEMRQTHHCQWTNLTENKNIENLKSGLIDFVGCTPPIQNLTQNDSFILDATLSITVFQDYKETYEIHRLGPSPIYFRGVSNIKIEDYCESKNLKSWCKNICRRTCMDRITGQNRLFCDGRYVTPFGSMFVGRNSDLYNRYFDPKYFDAIGLDKDGWLNIGKIINETMIDTISFGTTLEPEVNVTRSADNITYSKNVTEEKKLSTALNRSTMHLVSFLHFFIFIFLIIMIM